jgi:hypothetical protein
MRRSAIVTTAITFLFICVSFLIGCCWTLLFPIYGINGPTAQQGQERAVNLIGGLEQYKTDRGFYPNDLELLAPYYLPHIPQPALGWRYHYETQSGGEIFILSFMIGRNLDGDYCEYTSITKHWQCSDLI